MSVDMKTLTINGVTYTIADETARGNAFERVTTGGDGAAYTATVGNIKALTAGVAFIMIPHTVSTSVSPTLNVNGLGAKGIRRPITTNTTTTTVSTAMNWLAANKPVRVVYDGLYWVVDLVRPYASDLYGIVPIANGGTGADTAEAALASLGVTTYVDNAIQQAIQNTWNASY